MSGCVFGTGFGGAGSSSSPPAPQPGGFHMRLTGGAGWGTRYGTATALLEAQLVGGKEVFGGGGEIAVFLQHREPRRRIDGWSILARSTYSIGDREDADMRVFEISPGVGFSMFDRRHGPGSLGLYVINHRVVDSEDRVGWAHGVAFMIVGPISGVIEQAKRRRR